MGSRLQDAFEFATSHSNFARAFLSLVKAGQDESIIKRALSESGRVHPVFRVVATVTSRISVADPNLQQLRRSYRSLVSADPGLRLAYLDYAQFEPGVLAGLVSDESLLSAYNTGDVYLSLANRLFRDSSRRQLAKRVYLSFSYGMSPERIAKFLLGDLSSVTERSEYVDAIRSFFGNYAGIKDYQEDQQRQLLNDGFVSSVWGNRRYRDHHGALTDRERRWSLNHSVQSTASVIVKEALVDLYDEFGPDSIILPIHDAVLLQFRDDSSFRENVERGAEIMENSFSRRFPEVNVNVTARRFDSDDSLFGSC